MKEYPKIPRYDHPVVEEDWIEGDLGILDIILGRSSLLDEWFGDNTLLNKWFGDDVVVLEKYDGSNFRFALYDEYYREYESIDGATDGDFILGTSSVQRPECDVSEFQNLLEFESRLSYIKERVNVDKLRKLHKHYESPVIFFGENMVRHTIEYDWDSIEPLIIFDAYVPRNDTVDDTIYRRYEEEFTGFLDWNTVVDISEDVLNMKVARQIQTGINAESLSPDSIGQSEYSTGKAEGWVVRNDSRLRRVKVRTPEFKELNRKVWGQNVSEDYPGAKRIAYNFATSHRIKKEFKKAINEEGYDITPETMDYLTVEVVRDIWEEEWEEFHNQSFVPYDIYEYVADRIEGTLMRPDMFGFPDETENIANNWKFNKNTVIDSVSPASSNEYIKAMISDDILLERTRRIAKNSEREFGNWVIQELTDDIRYYIWYEKREDVLKISNEINGGEIDDSLYDITVPFVKKRDSI